VNGYYSLSQPKEISNFEFISSNNTKITKDFLKDKWTLVYFGFTNCPDECPVSMSMIRELFLTLSEKGMDLSDKQVLLISIDPENDTPSEIDMYAKGFNKNFYGAVAVRPMLVNLATQLDVMVTSPKQKNHSGHANHLDNHMNNIILIGPDQKYLGYFRPPFIKENLLLTYQSVAY
jgi:protein SCO1/2